MRSLRCLIATLFAMFTFVPEICGQDYPALAQGYGSRLSVEIDPVAFLYKGHALHLRYQPMFSERALIGFGAYAQNLPDQFVDLNSLNRDRGWNVRIRSAYFVCVEFYSDANYGWFIGEQIGFQSFKVTNENELHGSARFNNLMLLTYVGYSWHPFNGSFYIKPWIGLGFTEKIDGTNIVGSRKYHISPFFGSLTFHFGYTF